MNNNSPVDIVITWVDGHDPSWQKKKAEYEACANPVFETASSEIRYRDWDNLQYVFRGIEQFMPWVNKVFLITWGHLPAWLDTGNDKLRVVKHEDFIPEHYLPTFNSNTIELNIHRIDELSEDFILFNDDMFVIGPTTKEDFFQNGVPRATAALSPYPVRPGGIATTEVNNLEVINTYFSLDDIRRNKAKWIRTSYGSLVLRTILFLRAPCIFGIYEPHTPLAIKKTTLSTLWAKEPGVLDNTCLHKFRSKEDVNIWLARHWQLMEGNFIPRKASFSKNASLPRDLNLAQRLLKDPGSCRLLCINDSVRIQNFETTKACINAALQGLLPKKSSFEL